VNVQITEEAAMDAVEVVNRPEEGAMPDAMSALLASMIKQKTPVSTPTLRIVNAAVVMAADLDEVPTVVLTNDSSGRWYLLYC
jgi:hypothetical protein